MFFGWLLIVDSLNLNTLPKAVQTILWPDNNIIFNANIDYKWKSDESIVTHR